MEVHENGETIAALKCSHSTIGDIARLDEACTQRIFSKKGGKGNAGASLSRTFRIRV